MVAQQSGSAPLSEDAVDYMLRRPDAIGRAALWMMVALASFILITITGREAQRSVSSVELIALRSLLALAILLVAAPISGRRLQDLRSGQPMLQVARSSVHWAAQFCWLYALLLMPLAQLFAIEFTAPLWVAVLAPLLIGERLTAFRIAAALLGFIGAVIVARPGVEPLGAGAMFAGACAVGFALSMVATKRLTRTDDAFTILIYMTAIQSVLGLAMAAPVGHLIGVTPSLVRVLAAPPMAWVHILGVAVFGLTAHFALARAFTCADAILVAPMDFLRLPLIAVVAFMLYGEPFDPWVLGGAAVVIAGNIVNLLGERRRRL